MKATHHNGQRLAASPGWASSCPAIPQIHNRVVLLWRAIAGAICSLEPCPNSYENRLPTFYARIQSYSSSFRRRQGVFPSRVRSSFLAISELLSALISVSHFPPICLHVIVFIRPSLHLTLATAT